MYIYIFHTESLKLITTLIGPPHRMVVSDSSAPGMHLRHLSAAPGSRHPVPPVPSPPGQVVGPGRSCGRNPVVKGILATHLW